MSRTMSRMVTVAFLLACATPLRALAADGSGQAAVSQGRPSPSTEAKAPEGSGHAAAAKAASPGAASPEPGEAIEEDPGTGAHQAWVESIWSSP